MAIIYSYPVSTPKLDDLLIGTSIFDENDLTSQRGNPTVSFSLQSIVDLVATITGAQDLQQVTNVGATTTNTVTVSNLIVSGTIDAVGPIEDSTGSVGSTGQFLESTTTGTRWTTNSSNNYSWIVRDSQIVSVNKTLSGGQFLKLTTIYGSSTPDVTTLTGAGSALDPYLMTIPDTNYWTLQTDSTSSVFNKDALVNSNTIPVLTNGGSGYTTGTFIFSLEARSDSMQLNAYVGADGVINSLTIYKFGVSKYYDGASFSITQGGGTGGIVTLNVIGRQGILVQTTPLTLYPFTSANTDAVQTAVFDGYGNNQQDNNNGVLGNIESSCDGRLNQYANTLTLRATINPTAVQEIELSDPLNTSGWTIPSVNNRTATTSNGSGVNLLIRFDLKYVNGLLVASAVIDWPGQGYQDGEIVTLVGGNNLTTLTVTTNGGATQINTGPEMKFFGQRGGYNSGLLAYPNQRNTTFAKMASIKASAEQDFDSLVDASDILQRSPSSLIFSTARFTSTSATTGSTSMIASLRLFSTGQAQLYSYGDGNFTGTPTFNLSTTSSGYVIETPLYTWIARDSNDADKTLSVGQYLKFETAVGTPGATTLSGTGTTASPYLMTITSPDTNYTAGTGLTLNTLEFDANVDATVQTVQPVAVTDTALRTYAVQVDDTNDNLVVNVPWIAGGGGYILPVATVAALGGVRLFNDTVNDVAPETITTTANRNYVVELSTDHKMLVNVPWANTVYTLPVATNAVLGGIKIGYTDNAKNYAVELDADNEAYVNVPWTDTTYVLPLAADGTRGGVQIGYIQTATRDYPVTLDAEKMLVTVPWTDTSAPIQSLTTSGVSGVSTLAAGVLNIPNYANTQNTLTTTGTGAATLVGTVLNIPTPAVDITGSGADTQITIWDSATSITGNSNYTRDASNNISQGADTDVKNTIGRAVVDGGTINSDFAIFTHIDRVGSLDYAFMVSPNGSSYINAAGAGQTVQILDDNSSVANFSNGLIQLGATNVQLSQYGSGNVTGIATYTLSVDSTGKIIETPFSGGGGGLVSKVATNSFNATQLQTGGTLSFQLPSSVPVGKQLLIQDCVFYLDAGTVSFNYGTGVGSIIELKFNDGSTFSQSLVLASTQSFMNGANDNMQQGSQPNVFFPILYGDIVTTGGGTMQIVLPSVSGIAPTQGNGELYCSIKYIEIDTGINFGL